MKKSVLFVDDESKILDGLRRMLRGLRNDWDMRFVESGFQALEAMKNLPADVVISDMRMPGMSGSELLEKVQHRWPESVRIVLSGQCDQKTAIDSIGATHQFLMKPCDAEIIKETLFRIARLQDRIQEKNVKKMTTSLQNIYCMEQTRQAAQDHAEEHISFDRFIELVAFDSGIIAKLIQLVSSGFFGSGTKTVLPSKVLTMLGSDVLKSLYCHADGFFQVDPVAAHQDSWESLNFHNGLVAEVSRRIAATQTDSPAMLDACYTAGLLHNAGMYVLAYQNEELDGSIDETILEDFHYHRHDLCEKEPGRYRVINSIAGAYLLGLWGVPEELIDAVEFRHNPSMLEKEPRFSPLTALHVADYCCFSLSEGCQTPVFELDEEYLAAIGCRAWLDNWKAIGRQTYEEIAMPLLCS